ncbi:MAG: tetratricopeptide repeat protein, partial [Selenomonadaceae bacterium]|nr:tetratricopeptide repeat protein [Selenomonadaceae bacterium]
MRTIHQIPFAALGMGAAFTILWGVADPVAAFAEVKTYTGVGKCAMGDLVSPEQAKNYAREMALQNAREQAGVYLTSYTRTTNTRLSAKEITAISNNITEVVGNVKYTQTPTEADGVPVVVYTATLSANVDTDGIKKYLERGEEERVAIVSQSEQAQKDIAGSLEKIERLNEAYNKAQSEEEKEKIRSEFAEADRHLLAEQKNSEGLELLYKKDYKGAIQLFRQAIDLDSRYQSPWNNMGFAYDKLGQYDKAIEYYRKAIDINPKEATPWNNLGRSYEDKGDYGKAMECYQKAIEIDPKYATPWNNMGYV